MYIIPRKSQDIEVWDIRSTGDVVAVLTGRRAQTNQRIWTDLSSDGSWMVSGGTDGMVSCWRVDAVTGTVKPTIEFAVHDGVLLVLIRLTIDCVSTAVLHPSWPMLATCSGSHYFDMEEDYAMSEYSMKIWAFRNRVSSGSGSIQ